MMQVMPDAKKILSQSIIALMFSLLLPVGASSSAWAQSVESDVAAQILPKKVFSLSASASGEVANDLMLATLMVRADGEDATQLQSQVNASMQWALARLRPYTQFNITTGDYQTYPRYDRNRETIIGWSATQRVQLETGDVKSAGEAIGKLQERLQISGIQFMPKPSSREAAEDLLINQALDAFKQRAGLIRDNIGEPSYNLLDINVQTDSQQPLQRQRMELNLRSSAAVEAPGLQTGTSEITVRVNGRIQLGLPDD